MKRLPKALAAAVLSAVAAFQLSQPVQAGEKLNDMQIAHIAYTAGNIDIRYAHLAMAISESPEVRSFAATMLRDHAAVNDKALALLQKLKAQPQDNATSQQLIDQSNQLVAEMKGLSGAAFDKRYAENELAYHQFVNNAVENSFIPAAQNAEFKGLLGQALEIFKVHEGHAEMMVKAVSN